MTLNGLSMLFLVPSAIYNTWDSVITLELAWMDSKVTSDSMPLLGLIRWTLYDHLICHNIDYFHVSIVDMIQVGNNTESQLDELLGRKERKWIWDLCSITPYGLNQDDGYYCRNKRCGKR